MTKSYAGVILAGSLLIAGCSEEKSAPPAPSNAAPAPTVGIQPGTAAPVAPPSAVAPPPVAGAPAPAAAAGATAPAGAAPDNILAGVDRDYAPHLVNLNMAYQSYYGVFQKSPASLEELLKANYITEIPPVPPGKKYEIDSKHQRIIVVNK